jgi:tight adherence protein B
MDNLVLIIVAAVAAAGVFLVAMGLAGVAGGSAANDRITRYAYRERFGADAGGDADSTTAADRLAERGPIEQWVSAELARADVSLRVGEYLLLWAISIVGIPALFLAGSLIFPTLASLWAMTLAVILGIYLPRRWLRGRQEKRKLTFSRQLPDTVTLIANTLRSGSSVLQAFDTVVRESDPPVSDEFRRLLREVNLGVPMDQALDNVVRRIESDDLRLLATAISIQYTVGGNLAEILDTISMTLRERVRIQGEIRALTAQQRLSGIVVGALPFVLTVILLIIAPNYLAPMFRNPPGVLGYPAGVLAMSLGFGLMLIGFAWIRQIVNIKV